MTQYMTIVTITMCLIKQQKTTSLPCHFYTVNWWFKMWLLFFFILFCQTPMSFVSLSFIPITASDSHAQFLPDFFIWNKCCIICFIISQVSEMNQIGNHIIPVLYLCRIIFKCSCINFNFRTGKHFDNCSFQSIVVHANNGYNNQ